MLTCGRVHPHRWVFIHTGGCASAQVGVHATCDALQASGIASPGTSRASDHCPSECDSDQKQLSPASS